MGTSKRSPYRIYKRGQIWHAYLSTRINGRRINVRESTGHTEQENAEKWCLERIHALTTAPDITHEITLDAAAARWLIEIGQYQAQLSSREYVLGILLRELNSNCLLSEITKSDIIQFISRCRIKNRKPATINRYLAALSAIISRARDFWDCNTPKFKISQFKQKEPKENIVYFQDMEEVQVIIDNAPPHHKNMILTMLFTGLRLRKVLELRWSQIDFENRKIVYIGKGGDPEAVDIVDALFRVLNEIPHENEFVFTYRGKNLKNIYSGYRAAFEKAGIQYKSPHKLRHTVATWLLRSTNDLRLVKEALHHSCLSTTLKYAHLIPGRPKEELNNLFSIKSTQDKKTKDIIQ